MFLDVSAGGSIIDIQLLNIPPTVNPKGGMFIPQKQSRISLLDYFLNSVSIISKDPFDRGKNIIK